MSLRSTLDAWTPRLLSVLRIVAAFLFMQHGAQKLLGLLGAPAREIAPFSQIWFAGMLELFGGALLLLGLLTRPVAFLLSGMMAVAYFQSHAPKGLWPIMNKGELAALYCFLFLFLAAAGGGPWSLDRLLRRREAPESPSSPAAERRPVRRPRQQHA